MIVKLVYYDMYSKCIQYYSLCTVITHTDPQELQEEFYIYSKLTRILTNNDTVFRCNFMI